MTAVVNTAVDAIATLWLALTPNDRTSTPFHRLDDPEDELPPELREDTAGDRGFYFSGYERLAIEERDGGLTLCEWVVTATLLLSAETVGAGAMDAAFATDLNQMARAIELATSWPVGVSEVFTDDAGPTGETVAQGLVAGTVTLFILTEES